MMMRRALFASVLLLAGLNTANAVEIYQWTDSSGQVHFTDNPMEVPAGHRDHKKELDRLESVKVTGGEQRAKDEPMSPEKALWLQKCASCHHTGTGKKGRLVGLGQLTIDPDTKFPNTPRKMLKDMRAAADGKAGEMRGMAISDDELLTIARYLLEVQKK